MTSKERVLHTFNHREPDRVPLWCGASPEFITKAARFLGVSSSEKVHERFGDDFRRVFAKYIGPDEFSADYNLPKGASYRSPFGVVRHGYGYGQPMEHPLEGAGLKEIEEFGWPDPAWIKASAIKKDVARYHDEYAILGGDWSPFWHDAIDLMSMEGLLVAMYDAPEAVDALMKHIVDYYYGVNEIIFEEALDVIDIFFIGNDFGSQNGPIVGSRIFERYLLPHFKRLASLSHRYGLKVMLHCCGGFEPLIPSLIKAGIDALQALQPSAAGMRPAELKKKYSGKLVLNGCIDSQYVLIEGTPGLAELKTKEVLDIMMPGGGFILSPSHDYLLEETPVENVLAMYDAALEYGAYRK